jgi:hypothetical protein
MKILNKDIKRICDPITRNSLILGMIVIGFVLRILLIATTRGTNDVINWELFASTSVDSGIKGVYSMFSGNGGEW